MKIIIFLIIAGIIVFLALFSRVFFSPEEICKRSGGEWVPAEIGDLKDPPPPVPSKGYCYKKV